VILLPAVDIRDGKAVRLVQGDFARETVYNDDPLDAAKAWVEQGARSLHVVDLDGALQGKPANLDHLQRITAQVDVPVQYGGGLRDSRSVREALAAGADRVVIGTAAYTDAEFARDWADAKAVHGDQTTVESRPLCWDGRLLSLGEPATETARLALDGTMLAGDIGPGDWVALHWDWVCDKLTDRQLRALRTYTMRHLDMVNHRVDHPGPVAILG